jgi:Protein of unknown function (DUF1579)
MKILLILLLAIPSFVIAQAQTKSTMTEQEKKMMGVWSKLGEPGEHHKHIAQFAGKWNIAVKFRLDPAAPMQQSTGECEKNMVLGNRYLTEHCTSRTANSPEQFEGFGFLGYDNFKKQYVSYWFDNESTMVIPLYGKCDGKGKVFTLTGSYDDPVSGKTRQSRWIWTIIDQNKHALEMHDIDPDGKDNRNVEITYTRRL